MTVGEAAHATLSELEPAIRDVLLAFATFARRSCARGWAVGLVVLHAKLSLLPASLSFLMRICGIRAVSKLF